MTETRNRFASVAFVAVCGSALSILVSIAASQILLGVGIAALLLSGQRWRVPRVWLPWALFLFGTIISLLASGDPRAGMPQVRKLYVYLTLAAVFTVVRTIGTARRLLMAWCVVGGIGSAIGIVQFAVKWEAARKAHLDFYEQYVAARITGFMSHWMTFSGEQMLVLVVLLAFLLFGPLPRGWRRWAWMLAALAMSLAVLLSDTRSVWIAVFVAVVYLTWARRKVLVLAVPVAALLAFAVAPSAVRERAISLVRPNEQLDSNTFREVCWRTGWRMIQAHPWLGLGPEEVHKQFDQWVPADIPRPLPSGWYGHLHSIYIHYAAERGVPTMLMLVWMFAMMFYDFGRALKGLSPGRGTARFLLQAGIACVIAIMVEGAFELNLGDSEVLTMFLVMTACVYTAVGRDTIAAE